MTGPVHHTGGAAGTSVAAALVDEEMARLAASDVLRRAPSHRRLLQYLVDRRLADDATALREPAIAFEVFRRDPATFDAQADPIVRVTVGRLRARLDAHYAHCRPVPRLRIRLPKGSYRPEFVESRRAAEPPVGVAVQSVRNVTGDGALDGACLAFADALADRLARAGLPRVIARASVVEAEGRARSPHKLGAELGVAWLVESTLTREHKRDLRLSVRMVGAHDAAVHWVESAIAGDDDAYDLVDRMLDAIVLRAQATVAGGDTGHGAATGARPALPPAARARLDAARLLVLQRSIKGTDEAVAIAASLTREHPDTADGWAWLAAAMYSRMTFQDRADEDAQREIRASTARALALEPGHPVALRTEAILLGRRDYDIEAAEAMFRRALRTMPHYTSARLNLAELLALQGRAGETRAQLNLALIYDPLSVSVQLARAHLLGELREYDEAREAWALCRAGGEASVWLLVGAAMTELGAGDIAAADALAADALARFPDSPSAQNARAILYAAKGDAAAAHAQELATRARFPHFAQSQRAVIAALCGERDAALAALEAALACHDMSLQQALGMPAFDALAGAPRFRAVAERCGVRGRLVAPSVHASAG